MTWMLRSRLRAGVVLVLLVFADVWGALTVWNAVAGGQGEGAVFWTAVLVVAVLLGLCVWFTVGVVRRLASRP